MTVASISKMSLKIRSVLSLLSTYARVTGETVTKPGEPFTVAAGEDLILGGGTLHTFFFT